MQLLKDPLWSVVNTAGQNPAIDISEETQVKVNVYNVPKDEHECPFHLRNRAKHATIISRCQSLAGN